MKRYRFGLMGRLQPNPKWPCPDCGEWIATCPCSLADGWRPTRGQLLEACYRAELRPIARMIVLLPVPMGEHLWDRAAPVAEFPLREVCAWTGLKPSGLRREMTALVKAGWLSGPIRVPKADRVVRVAVTIPRHMLALPSMRPDTGRQRTRGMMRR